MYDNARYLFNVHHRTLYIWLNENINLCVLSPSSENVR